MYRLIINSNMPQSESFESWIFDEVLPSIRKRGYYGLCKPGKGDYIDARDIPYRRVRYNGGDTVVNTAEPQRKREWPLKDFLKKNVREAASRGSERPYGHKIA